jgi:hypothetical protein
MADLRVSQLTEATSVALTDLLYLSKAGTDRKVTVQTLLNSGSQVNNTATQTLSTTGVLDLSKPITVITTTTSNFTVTVGSGTEGQMKTVLLKNTTGGVVTLSGLFSGYSTVQLSAIGDSVRMIYLTGEWFIQGGINQPVV